MGMPSPPGSLTHRQVGEGELLDGRQSIAGVESSSAPLLRQRERGWG